MSIANINEYFAGDTLQISFTVLQSDGTPQDLTNCQIVWGVSKQKPLTSPLITKSNGTGVVVIDEVGGLLTVTIDKGELTQIGDLYHELEITLPSGQSFTYAQGTLTSVATIYPN